MLLLLRHVAALHRGHVLVRLYPSLADAAARGVVGRAANLRLHALEHGRADRILVRVRVRSCGTCGTKRRGGQPRASWSTDEGRARVGVHAACSHVSNFEETGDDALIFVQRAEERFGALVAHADVTQREAFEAGAAAERACQRHDSLVAKVVIGEHDVPQVGALLDDAADGRCVLRGELPSVEMQRSREGEARRLLVVQPEQLLSHRLVEHELPLLRRRLPRGEG